MNEKKRLNKEAIIAEYLAGGISYRELGTKYGLNFRRINKWVLAYQGRVNKKPLVEPKPAEPQGSLPVEVEQLRKELRKAQLHNKLLEAIIDIGQQQYGIDLRKIWRQAVMRVEQVEPRCLAQLCSLLGYSRQAYHQGKREYEKGVLEAELVVQEVQRIRQSQKRVGTRKLLRMMSDFLPSHSIGIGRDGLFDLLRENGLLIRKRKRRQPITTWSNHWFRKYPNLIQEFIPTAPNQLWVSDITYIVENDDFAYLSLITDAYSRKIVGFYLSEDLSAKGCISALKMALESNPTHTELIHHSDRGSQYCCGDYVTILEKEHIHISMTQSGDPLENAMAERVNGILKEELLERNYNDFEKAQRGVAIAICVYNYQRLQLSIDMLTPVQAHHLEGEIKKHWKNYYSKRKEAQKMTG